jgi:hypothetical protein
VQGLCCEKFFQVSAVEKAPLPKAPRGCIANPTLRTFSVASEPPQAVDAECIHDSIRMVSGNLDLTMDGPPYQDFVITLALSRPPTASEPSSLVEYANKDGLENTCRAIRIRRSSFLWIEPGNDLTPSPCGKVGRKPCVQRT